MHGRSQKMRSRRLNSYQFEHNTCVSVFLVSRTGFLLDLPAATQNILEKMIVHLKLMINRTRTQIGKRTAHEIERTRMVSLTARPDRKK